jgi:peptidoglycan L-alanyl-D-glutamate endopeptidase CwlK
MDFEDRAANLAAAAPVSTPIGGSIIAIAPMDRRSEACLAGVHPDLGKIIRLGAARSSVPYIVIHGLRDLAEERANVAKGVSQTLHSRHMPNAHGLACAVDIAAAPGGHISWDAALYRQIAVAVKAAAAELGLPVEWGGDWKSLKDWGHFQLPWSSYP